MKNVFYESISRLDIAEEKSVNLMTHQKKLSNLKHEEKKVKKNQKHKNRATHSNDVGKYQTL